MTRLRRLLGVSLAILALAGLASVWLEPAEAARRRGSPPQYQYREVETILNSFIFYTDQQIVDILRDYTFTFILPHSKSIRPVGHPEFSVANCASTPNSFGCRARDIRALADSQGVESNRICMAFRADVHNKLPGYAMDVIDGVPFDPDWLLRMPGDAFEARVSEDYRGGISYSFAEIDAVWANSLEDDCCHNGTIGDCTDQDQCLVRYGRSNDVTQVLSVVTLAGDMRIPAYREWTAKRLLARVADAEPDCAVVAYKPGWWSYYDGPETAWECFREGDNNWAGSTLTWDPCALHSSPVLPTPYGPGEFEAGMNAFFDEVFVQMQSKNQTFPLITTERPAQGTAAWTWMENHHVQNPILLGEMATHLRPYIPPSTGLSVYFTPPPGHGVAPFLDVDITMDVRGNAAGPINFHLWCDCNVTGTDVVSTQSTCGTGSGDYHEYLGETSEPLVVTAACDYPAVGTYVPKMIVEREGLLREDRIAVNVD